MPEMKTKFVVRIQNSSVGLGSWRGWVVSGMNIGLGLGSEVLMPPGGQDALGLDVALSWDCGPLNKSSAHTWINLLWKWD